MLDNFSHFLEAARTQNVSDLSAFVVTSYTESRRKSIHRINRPQISEGG